MAGGDDRGRTPAPGIPETEPPSALTRRFLRSLCQTSETPMGVEIVQASGSLVWDARGRAYLDLLAGMGVANVGHRHPEVVAAVRRQSEAYLHAMVYGEYVQEPQVALAEALAGLLPAPLSVTYFTNSGAEAVEGALKLARKVTGRPGFVAFEGAFHGDTFGALSVGGNPVYRRPFEPLLPEVRLLPFGSPDAADRIDESIAAVIVEPIQAEGGVRAAPPGFLGALRQRCTAVGALLIFDEVVTGFGRTGRWFAAEHWGVVPDVVVLAKALGGGMPLGAFVSRPELMAVLSRDPPLAHVTTFGGHPVSCAAGLAALEVARRLDLPARAARLGAVWLDRLRRLAGPVLRAVRGCGLLLGLEFATAARAEAFVRRAFARGLIVNWTLHRDTVVRLAPPLVLSDGQSEWALSVIEALVRDAERETQ